MPRPKTRPLCSDLLELRIDPSLVPTRRYQTIRQPPQYRATTHTPLRHCDPPLILSWNLVCLREGERERSLETHGYTLALHYQTPRFPQRRPESPISRCVTTPRLSTSVGTSDLSSEHGVRITRRHIDAAPRLLWRLNSGTCKALMFNPGSISCFSLVPAAKADLCSVISRLDQRCGTS